LRTILGCRVLQVRVQSPQITLDELTSFFNCYLMFSVPDFARFAFEAICYKRVGLLFSKELRLLLLKCYPISTNQFKNGMLKQTAI